MRDKYSNMPRYRLEKEVIETKPKLIKEALINKGLKFKPVNITALVERKSSSVLKDILRGSRDFLGNGLVDGYEHSMPYKIKETEDEQE